MAEDKGHSGGKKVVTSRNKAKTVLQWDADGDILEFDSEDFLDLGSFEKDLGHSNRVLYTMALQFHKAYVRSMETTVEKDGVQVPQNRMLSVAGGSAAGRLAHEDTEAGFHYTNRRPDEVKECEALGYEKLGTKVLDKDGKPELVEMRIPEERYQEHLRAVGDESDRRRAGGLVSSKEAMAAEATIVDETTISKETVDLNEYQ